MDEPMFPFKEKLGLKQYMPNKPIKHVIKVWARVYANNSFVSKFDAYTGKKGRHNRKGARIHDGQMPK